MRTARSKIGTADEVAARVAEARQAGRRVVLASGRFDLVLADHARALEGLTSDQTMLVVAVLAADAAPIAGDADRALVVAALRAVDHVLVVPAPELPALAARLGADAHHALEEAAARERLARMRR